MKRLSVSTWFISALKIKHEPDGNITPDFLVDGKIAIEVRSLNQNEITETGFQALDIRANELVSRLDKVLPSLGPPTNGRSWYVHFGFVRPFPPWPNLKSGVLDALSKFRDDPDKHPRHHTICDVVELELIPATGSHPTSFLSGGSSDGDTGGMAVEEIRKNLELCLLEKTSKMVKVREKYPEWWLVIVDHIGYGFSLEDRPVYENAPRISHIWDKVILAGPLDLGSWLEIPRHKDTETPAS